jgi:hypothetical protein
MIVNLLVTLFFGYLLLTKDYSIHPKWIYYMDGIIFSFNFAVVLLTITDRMGI